MSAITILTLAHDDADGRTVLAVAPGKGMNVVGIAHAPSRLDRALPLLEPVDMASFSMRPTSFGMPVLGPTPGRVGEGQSGLFTFHGRQYRIRPARHGFLRDLEWEVERLADAFLQARVSVRPSGGKDEFPFEFSATYEVTVGAARARATIVVENTGDRIQPINLGWHPYLHKPGPVRVTLPAQSVWQLDGRHEPTPTGVLLPVSGRTDFRKGRVLDASEHWDDVFTGLDAAGGDCECSATDVSRSTRRWLRFALARTGIGRPLRHVQLFTPVGREAICIEPLSCPPDAINLRERGHGAADVCEVTPGERVAFSVEVGIDAGPPRAG